MSSSSGFGGGNRSLCRAPAPSSEVPPSPTPAAFVGGSVGITSAPTSPESGSSAGATLAMSAAAVWPAVPGRRRLVAGGELTRAGGFPTSAAARRDERESWGRLQPASNPTARHKSPKRSSSGGPRAVPFRFRLHRFRETQTRPIARTSVLTRSSPHTNHRQATHRRRHAPMSVYANPTAELPLGLYSATSA